GLIIPKRTFGEIQAAGIEAFRKDIESFAPPFRGRMAAVADWNDVKLLTVAVDRLVQWYRPGFLCIGDAAHAMSPIGGVGINLAIQDAVAASNLCAIPLREGRLTVEHLRSVQHRRELPARLIQLLQVFIQQRVLRPILRADKDVRVPLPIQFAASFTWLHR